MLYSSRRWWFVVLAVLGIGVIELFSDTWLDPLLPFPLDTLVVMAGVALVGFTIAALAFRSIDRLAEALLQQNAELEARAEAARTLHRVSMALTALSGLDAILQAVVDSTLRLLDGDVALLVLVRPDGTLHLAATSGPREAFHLAGELPGSDFARFVDRALLRSHLAAPLQRAGQTIGTLAVGARDGRAYGVDAVERLSSLASQAAIAIENDRLQRQLRELAIRGERERIAREMHDGLAQVLGYVNTKSQAVRELLAAGQTDAARVQLEELATAARSVYVDVREAILGLSSPIEPERGLVGALEAYASRFAEASKLATTVEADDAAAELRLTPFVQAQVFRIVQEALTNVRKHAAAARVTIHLAASGGLLAVEVRDDGRSFLPDAGDGQDWPHYGLRSMRERADALGAELTIEPVPGGGTRLALRVPLAAALEVA